MKKILKHYLRMIKLKQQDYPKELVEYIFVSPILWLIKKIRGANVIRQRKRKS